MECRLRLLKYTGKKSIANMRVLQIVANIGIKSGVSSFIMNVYRNIDKTRYQFDFLVAKKVNESYEEEIRQLGGNVHYMPNPLSFRLFSACSYCSHFFLSHSKDYQVVHLHSPTMAMMTACYARKAGIKKVIIHSHSTNFSTNAVKRIINSILVSKIDKCGTDFWFCSPEAGEFLFGKGTGIYIPNAIDTGSFRFDEKIRQNTRQQLGIAIDQKVVCHVSNFSPLKNIDFLVPVIQDVVKNELKTWKFIFVGDGPDRSKFEHKLTKMGLNHDCIFVGFQSSPIPYLYASDIFVLPSLSEGAPVSILEAQASGLRCIVSDSITRTVDVTGISYLPLENRVWTREILNTKLNKKSQRISNNDMMQKSVFSINYLIDQIMDLYGEGVSDGSVF